MKRITKKKLLALVLCIAVLAQVLLINYTSTICKDYQTNQSTIEDFRLKTNKNIIDNTIRPQQCSNLMSLKQSWEKYLQMNGDNLILKDLSGYTLYKQIEGDISIGFNPDTMKKEQGDFPNSFNIFDKSSNELLMKNVKPQWNYDEVQKILDILIRPYKVVGNNGGYVIYDSNSGEIFLDTTPVNRLKSKEEVSIFDDISNPKNKNKEATSLEIDTYFKQKKDSTKVSNIIYMFNEATQMGNDKDNYSKYPLGEYNRQFIEMAVLPYETLGFDGQPMQLTVLSVADENDIYSTYKIDNSLMKEVESTNKILYFKVVMLLYCTAAISIALIFITLYIFKIRLVMNEE